MLTLSLTQITRNSRQLPFTFLMFSKELKNPFTTEPLTPMPMHFHKSFIPQVSVKSLPLSNVLRIYPVVWPILVSRYSCKELLRTHLACWAFALWHLILAIYNKKIEDVFKPRSLQTFISLSHSEHSFGEINALLTTLTKSKNLLTQRTFALFFFSVILPLFWHWFRKTCGFTFFMNAD